jgi:hypothetical protein
VLIEGESEFGELALHLLHFGVEGRVDAGLVEAVGRGEMRLENVSPA